MVDVQVAPAERKTLTVEEAAQELGIGRRLAYELARRGELPGVIRLGRRYVVSRSILNPTLAPSNVSELPQFEVDGASAA